MRGTTRLPLVAFVLAAGGDAQLARMPAFLNEFDSTIGHTFVRFTGAAVLSAMALEDSTEFFFLDLAGALGARPGAVPSQLPSPEATAQSKLNQKLNNLAAKIKSF